MSKTNNYSKTSPKSEHKRGDKDKGDGDDKEGGDDGGNGGTPGGSDGSGGKDRHDAVSQRGAESGAGEQTGEATQGGDDRRLGATERRGNSLNSDGLLARAESPGTFSSPSLSPSAHPRPLDSSEPSGLEEGNNRLAVEISNIPSGHVSVGRQPPPSVPDLIAARLSQIGLMAAFMRLSPSHLPSGMCVGGGYKVHDRCRGISVLSVPTMHNDGIVTWLNTHLTFVCRRQPRDSTKCSKSSRSADKPHSQEHRPPSGRPALVSGHSGGLTAGFQQGKGIIRGLIAAWNNDISPWTI